MTLNKDSLSNDDDVPKTDKRDSNSAFTVRNSLLAGSAADRKSTRLNYSHASKSRMPSSA